MRLFLVLRVGAALGLAALALSCASSMQAKKQGGGAAGDGDIQVRLGASDVDVAFSLFSAEKQIDLLVTMHVPADNWPAREAGGCFEPGSVNHRILMMLAVQRTLEYLDGRPMPGYMAVKAGMESVEAVRKRGQTFFVARHPLEWSAQPLGLRFGQDVAWLEPDVAASVAAKARWERLDGTTWRSFWLGLDKRYDLSRTFPAATE